MNEKGDTMKKIIVAGFALGALSTGVFADEAAQDAAIVAAQVRDQGNACEEPVSAVRDEAASKPDVPVYQLTCANARYTVKIIPDQAAEISTAE